MHAKHEQMMFFFFHFINLSITVIMIITRFVAIWLANYMTNGPHVNYWMQNKTKKTVCTLFLFGCWSAFTAFVWNSVWATACVHWIIYLLPFRWNELFFFFLFCFKTNAHIPWASVAYRLPKRRKEREKPEAVIENNVCVLQFKYKKNIFNRIKETI